MFGVKWGNNLEVKMFHSAWKKAKP